MDFVKPEYPWAWGVFFGVLFVTTLINYGIAWLLSRNAPQKIGKRIKEWVEKDNKKPP
jgi:hypothetical protein